MFSRIGPARPSASLRGRWRSRYSTFCTCSRMRSSSVFSSTIWWAIGASLPFEPIVFASRPNSWSRKSSRRPTGLPRPGARQDLAELLDVAAQPHDLLGHVEAVGGDHDLLVQARLVEQPDLLLELLRRACAAARAPSPARARSAARGTRRARPRARVARAGRAPARRPRPRASRRAPRAPLSTAASSASRSSPSGSSGSTKRATPGSESSAARRSSSPRTPSRLARARGRAQILRGRGEIDLEPARPRSPPGAATVRSTLPRSKRRWIARAHVGLELRERRGSRIRASR